MPNKADIPKYQTVEDWLAALPVRLRAKLAGKVSMEPEGMIVVVKDGTLSDKEIAKLYSKATHNNPVRIGRATCGRRVLKKEAVGRGSLTASDVLCQ
jgi:hypothetical protein